MIAVFLSSNILAQVNGFEPLHTVLETAVLPHYTKLVYSNTTIKLTVVFVIKKGGDTHVTRIIGRKEKCPIILLV